MWCLSMLSIFKKKKRNGPLQVFAIANATNFSKTFYRNISIYETKKCLQYRWMPPRYQRCTKFSTVLKRFSFFLFVQYFVHGTLKGEYSVKENEIYVSMSAEFGIRIGTDSIVKSIEIVRMGAYEVLK